MPQGNSGVIAPSAIARRNGGSPPTRADNEPTTLPSKGIFTTCLVSPSALAISVAANTKGNARCIGLSTKREPNPPKAPNSAPTELYAPARADWYKNASCAPWARDLRRLIPQLASGPHMAAQCKLLANPKVAAPAQAVRSGGRSNMAKVCSQNLHQTSDHRLAQLLPRAPQCPLLHRERLSCRTEKQPQK